MKILRALVDAVWVVLLLCFLHNIPADLKFVVAVLLLFSIFYERS